MEIPQVSVIVPVYNVEKYLSKCIESVIHQTFKDFELILVDDGSTDGSSKICDDWKDSDSRVKVIHKKNGGLSEARNIGLDNSKGNYVFFLDSDDYIMPDTLYSLYNAVQGKKKGIAVGNTLLIWDDKESKGRMILQGKLSPKKALLALLQDEIPNYAVGKLYSVDLWESVRFPVGKAFEDIRTIYKVFWESQYVYIEDYAGYCYLQRQNSITDRAVHTRLDAIEAYKEQLEFARVYCEEAVPVLEFKVQETTARYVVLDNYVKNRKIGKQLNTYKKWVFKNFKSILSGKLNPVDKRRCRIQLLALISPSMYSWIYITYVNWKKKRKCE